MSQHDISDFYCIRLFIYVEIIQHFIIFGICQLETVLILTYNEEEVFFLLLPLAGTLKWTNYGPLQYLQPTEIFLRLEKMKEPYIIVKKRIKLHPMHVIAPPCEVCFTLR